MSTKNQAFSSNFGERLRVARKKTKLNQADLAAWVGVTSDTLSRYERGELTPSAEVFALIVSRFTPQFSADWFLFGEDDATQPVLIDNFGSLTRLGFEGRGTADVAMSFPEVTRILKACIAFEFRKERPNQKIIDKLLSLVEYYYDDGSEIELLARVVIGSYAVKLVAEGPGMRESEVGGETEIQSAMKKAAKDSPSVLQKIGGKNHQIAGRDIINKGDKKK